MASQRGHQVTWTQGSRPDHPGLYAIIVGAGTPVLATWNARDGRWFTGAQMVQPQYVRAYCPIPVYEGEE